MPKGNLTIVRDDGTVVGQGLPTAKACSTAISEDIQKRSNELKKTVEATYTVFTPYKLYGKGGSVTQTCQFVNDTEKEADEGPAVFD